MNLFTLFTQKIKRALTLLVSIALLAPLTLPYSLHAQTRPCNDYLADRGEQDHCAAIRVGGIPIAYPKLNWERVSEIAQAEVPGGPAVIGSPSALALTNRTATVLGLSDSDIANVVSIFPSNVPYVFGRYDPLSGELRVDIFKLEKSGVGSSARVGLYHTVFTPSHGDHWRAIRSYISPDAYRTGITPGVNPFASFRQTGSDSFHNITLTGAQVAMGHAMRMVGAPAGLLSVAEARTSSVTRKSGNAFRRRVETWVYGHAKSRWFIAQPVEALSRSTTPEFAAICASNPRASDCPRFATAVSGVSFEEFEGGTLSGVEDTWQIDYQRKSGLGFLGALILGVIGSFALAGILSAAGIGAGVGATTGSAAASSTMGTFGSMLVNTGTITGFSSLGAAVAVEAAFVAVKMAVIGGANLSSVIRADFGVLTGSVKVDKGFRDNVSLNKYEARIRDQVRPRTNSAIQHNASTLSSFRNTVIGQCAPGARIADCAGNTGVVPRVDQYNEVNQKQFIKKHEGMFVRDTLDAFAPR